MAELHNGRVIRMRFGGGDVDDIRVFERLLEGIEGISGFVIDRDDQVVVAFASTPDQTEDRIVRALLASGMYPVMSNNTARDDGRGHLAC